MLGRQRDDDLLDAMAGGQGREAQLEDGAAADIEKLFGPVGAEANAPASCGDNGGNMHVEVEIVFLPKQEASMKRPLLTIALLVFAAVVPAAAQDANYGLESRAAIGAHHICSGLWVVRCVTNDRRTRSSHRTSRRSATSVGTRASLTPLTRRSGP